MIYDRFIISIKQLQFFLFYGKMLPVIRIIFWRMTCHTCNKQMFLRFTILILIINIYFTANLNGSVQACGDCHLIYSQTRSRTFVDCFSMANTRPISANACHIGRTERLASDRSMLRRQVCLYRRSNCAGLNTHTLQYNCQVNLCRNHNVKVTDSVNKTLILC